MWHGSGDGLQDGDLSRGRPVLVEQAQQRRGDCDQVIKRAERSMATSGTNPKGAGRTRPGVQHRCRTAFVDTVKPGFMPVAMGYAADLIRERNESMVRIREQGTTSSMAAKTARQPAQPAHGH